jgi:hypothetical protein
MEYFVLKHPLLVREKFIEPRNVRYYEVLFAYLHSLGVLELFWLFCHSGNLGHFFLHQTKMAAILQDHNSIFELFALQCIVIHYFQGFGWCRIHFWCKILNVSLFNTLNLHTLQMAAELWDRHSTFEPFAQQLLVIHFQGLERLWNTFLIYNILHFILF